MATVAGLGWRDESDPRDEKWPIRFTGTDGAVPWTMSVSPGPVDVEDIIWWETDAVRADAFLVVAGYTRAGTLDWHGHGGVKNAKDIDVSADTVMSELGTVADLDEVEARAFRQYPWLTIGAFVEQARDVPIVVEERRHLDVKAANEQLARSLFDAGVMAALQRCMRDVNTADGYLRIWVGAPNLRIELATLTDDNEQRRLETMTDVAALGTALVRTVHRTRRPAI